MPNLRKVYSDETKARGSFTTIGVVVWEVIRRTESFLALSFLVVGEKGAGS